VAEQVHRAPRGDAELGEDRREYAAKGVRREVLDRARQRRKSGERSARAVEDERLLSVIRQVHESNYFAYGYRRMWMALKRAGEHVGRCRDQRLMKTHGIHGAKRRGKP
jgi:putative transposase